MAALLAALAPPKPRTRWIAVAAVALVAAAVGSAAALGFAQDPASPCAAAGAGVAEMWNDDAAARVRTAFADTGLSYAADAADRAVAGLTAYAGDLRAGRADACEATHVRKSQSQDQLGRRGICLDRGARALRATAHRFGRADAATVERAVEALSDLPDLARCRDVEALTLGADPPSPALAADVAAIRDRLAEARAAELAGDVADALRIAGPQLAAADASGYGPVRAQAAFAVGRLRLRQRTEAEVKAGEQLLWDALDLAESHRDDALKAEVWIDLVGAAIDIGDDPERARPWVRQAVATVERLGGPFARSRLRVEAQWMQGKLYYRSGDMAAAEDAFRRSLALVAELPSVDGVGEARGSVKASRTDRDSAFVGTTLAARIHHELANTLRARSQTDEARQQYERALAEWGAAVGARHPHIARLSLDFAGFCEETGDFDRARELIESAIEVFSQVHGADHPRVGKAYLVLANIEQQQGDLARAGDRVRAAREIYQRSLPVDHVEQGDVWVFTGLLAFRERRFGDALAAWQRALAIQQQALPAGDPTPTLTVLNIAEAQVALGRHADAIATLDSVDAAVQALTADLPIVTAFAGKVRGQAQLGLGRTRDAIQTLRRALDGFRAQPGYPVELADVLWALARAQRRVGAGLDDATRALAQEAQALYEAQGRPALSRDITTWLRR